MVLHTTELRLMLVVGFQICPLNYCASQPPEVMDVPVMQATELLQNNLFTTV